METIWRFYQSPRVGDSTTPPAADRIWGDLCAGGANEPRIAPPESGLFYALAPSNRSKLIVVVYQGGSITFATPGGHRRFVYFPCLLTVFEYFNIPVKKSLRLAGMSVFTNLSREERVVSIYRSDVARRGNEESKRRAVTRIRSILLSTEDSRAAQMSDLTVIRIRTPGQAPSLRIVPLCCSK